MIIWFHVQRGTYLGSMYDDISVSDLCKYFSAKVCDSEYTNDVILETERCVQEKYDGILNGELNSKVMYEAMVKRYIKKLHLGSSPGIDGIISEHLKYAINSGIMRDAFIMFKIWQHTDIIHQTGACSLAQNAYYGPVCPKQL